MNIRRDRLEDRVLDALRTRLMDPGLFRAFCKEFTREQNRLRIESGIRIETVRSELVSIDRSLDRLVQAVMDGVPATKIKEKMAQLEAKKRALTAIVADAQDPTPLLHPSMAEIYRSKIVALHLALNDEAARGEATDILRSLIDTILLTPGDGELRIELRGDLADILAIATNAKGRPGRDGLLSQFEMVAGRRNRLYRTCFRANNQYPRRRYAGLSRYRQSDFVD